MGITEIRIRDNQHIHPYQSRRKDSSGTTRFQRTKDLCMIEQFQPSRSSDLFVTGKATVSVLHGKECIDRVLESSRRNLFGNTTEEEQTVKKKEDEQRPDKGDS